MNRPEIIKEFAKRYGYTQSQSGIIFDQIYEFIFDTLCNGGTINMHGLLSLGVRTSKERNGINPYTLEHIKIPSKRVPACVFGKALKRALRTE